MLQKSCAAAEWGLMWSGWCVCGCSVEAEPGVPRLLHVCSLTSSIRPLSAQWEALVHEYYYMIIAETQTVRMRLNYHIRINPYFSVWEAANASAGHRPQCAVCQHAVSLQSWATTALAIMAPLFIFGFPFSQLNDCDNNSVQHWGLRNMEDRG